MWLNYFTVLFIPFIAVHCRGELITDENRAREFLRSKDETIIRRCEAKEDQQYFLLDTRANDFAWQNFSDPLLKRAFQKTAANENFFLMVKEQSNTELEKKISELYRKSDSILSNSGACVYRSEEKRQTDENCTKLPPHKIVEKFYKTGNADERKYYWIAWRDSIGKVKKVFLERLRIDIESNRYPDTWLLSFNEISTTIVQDMDRAFQDIFPLYKELHAFVRRRLINTYRNERISSDGPIPSHLLDLITEDWFAAKEVALPYPEAKVDVTKIMKERNMKTIDLLKLAEDFFHSLGLPNIDDNVWNNTKISTSEDCEPTLNFQQSCRRILSGMTACIPVDEFDLHFTIGYMLDIFLYQDGRPDWPRSIHTLPSSAFRPALQKAVEVSTWTNKYMASKGFVQAVPAVSEQMSAQEMNDLMMAALRFLTPLPYIYRAAKWRWDSYSPIISDKYNQKWWEYSLEYQGICPPVRRTEENFDPVTTGRIDWRFWWLIEFTGIVYSFQFHKAICEEIGHDDSLHRCNLYGEKAFGDKIRNIFYLGNSVSPTEALSMMTNGASNKMDTKPLLEYFQPLYEWLKIKNKNETVGWKSDDPMVCP